MNLDLDTYFTGKVQLRSFVGTRVVELGAGVVERRSLLNIESGSRLS